MGLNFRSKTTSSQQLKCVMLGYSYRTTQATIMIYYQSIDGEIQPQRTKPYFNSRSHGLTVAEPVGCAYTYCLLTLAAT